MKKNPLDTILGLLREEKKLYTVLLKKLEAQKEAVEKEDDAALPALLDAKEALTKSICETDKDMRERFQKLAPPQRQLLIGRGERIRQDIEAMLGQIIEIENHCHAELSARKSEITRRFVKIREGKTLTKGYRFAQRKQSKFHRSV